MKYFSFGCPPRWSSGQDSWLSPTRPGFDSRSGSIFNLVFSYMSDQIIPERIFNYYPDVKVIMLLCEPEHRTLSHFLHAVSLRDIHFNHAYLNKFGSYSDVINDGFSTMLTDYPDLLSDLSDISKTFTRFTDLRDAVYR